MRKGWNDWPTSLSPHDFIGEIDKKTVVVAVTAVTMVIRNPY
jgi:hypothetical protein